MEILENHKSQTRYLTHYHVPGWFLRCTFCLSFVLVITMALAVESRNGSMLDAAPEILSDERIEELLKGAETRLRAKAGLEPISANEDVLALETTDAAPSRRVHLARLEHNLDRSSYLKNHNGIAKASPDLMVPAEQRKMADGLRTVRKELGNSKKVVSQSLSQIPSPI